MARVVQPDFNKWAKEILATWGSLLTDRAHADLKRAFTSSLVQAYQQGVKDGRNHNKGETLEGTPT